MRAPRTFDEYGDLVDAIPSRRRRGLGDAVVAIDDTVGGKIWEWLHPGALQREYDLTGRTAPDVTAGDVLDTAVARTIETAQAAKASFVAGFKLAGVALVAGAVLYGLHLYVEHEKARRRK